MKEVGGMTAKQAVAELASPGIEAIRHVYRYAESDAQRIAALIEIAGAAAALARTVRRYRPVDAAELYGLVTRRADVGPVLGRGQWLPTMTFHVPEAARIKPKRRKATGTRVPRRPVPAGTQLALFGPRSGR
jgi:hypothetical protein